MGESLENGKKYLNNSQLGHSRLALFAINFQRCRDVNKDKLRHEELLKKIILNLDKRDIKVIAKLYLR